MSLKDTDDRTATTTALRALGVAIYGGIAATTGILLRWFIQLDGVYDPPNEYFANFLTGAGTMVALGALLVVAKALVSVPPPPPPSAPS